MRPGGAYLSDTYISAVAKTLLEIPIRFQSAHPEIFVAHADTDFLKDMSTTAIARDSVQLLELQSTLERISKLPQATIAKIEGFARGGGHEFALACDMRFAARGKAKFMQMEVGMGILPCGGGASRMARQVGLGRALEIILGAQDFDADQAEAYGTVNRTFEPDEIAFTEDLSDIPDGRFSNSRHSVLSGSMSVSIS